MDKDLAVEGTLEGTVDEIVDEDMEHEGVTVIHEEWVTGTHMMMIHDRACDSSQIQPTHWSSSCLVSWHIGDLQAVQPLLSFMLACQPCTQVR